MNLFTTDNGIPKISYCYYLNKKKKFSKKISINNEFSKFMENKFIQTPKVPLCLTNFPQKISQFDPYDTLFHTNLT